MWIFSVAPGSGRAERETRGSEACDQASGAVQFIRRRRERTHGDHEVGMRTADVKSRRVFWCWKEGMVDAAGIEPATPSV